MGMISIEEAFRIVMNSASTTGVETIHFTKASCRILAEDVFSDVDMPPFNRAAVDGYACNAADKEGVLKVVEIIRAGKVPQNIPGRGECAKIMTGAIVPDSCNFVFPVEDSAELPGNRVRFTGKMIKANISRKAEDLKAGEMVLGKFKYLNPQDIALLASVGKTMVNVARKPKVAILSTGDELVEPDRKPELSQIRNSNGWQLVTQAERAGADARYYGIAPDDEESTFILISEAIAENSIVILTGGVSMGDFDFVPSVLKRAGVQLLFDQINVQPGKPTTFGIHSNGVVFGLPGNPVSAFIQFETLVRPFINLTMGYDWKPLIYKAEMAERYERKSSVRFGWIPVKVTDDGKAVAVDYHGSAHISAFPYADGIIGIEAGKNFVEKGEIVSVRQI